MLIDCLLYLFKTLLCVAVVYAVYTIHRLIYVPLRERRYYSKYSNVSMNERYYPVVGDLACVLQNQNANKFRFQFFIDMALQDHKYDFYVFQQGANTFVNVLSIEALSEFELLVPTKIDRHSQKGGFPVGKIVHGSFVISESTKEFQQRRKEAAKAIGINHISKYIPLMLETTDEWIKSVKRNETLDLSFEMMKIVFKFITKMLFGTDVDQMKPIPYISPKTGKLEDMSLEKFYLTYPRDEFDGYLSFKGIFAPFFEQYGVSEPYSSNVKNRRALVSELKDFTSKTTDTNSVYKRLEALCNFTQDDLISDASALLFAGFDTITHLVVS